MRRTAFFTIAATTILLAGLFINTQSSNAWVDGRAKAQAWEPIIFPNIVVGDTLTSIKVKGGPHEEISFQIKVESRRHAGAMTSADTVFYQLQGSVNDTSFVNLSATGATIAITTAGVYKAVYDYLKSCPFITLGFSFQAADSVTVKTSAFISTSEGR